MPTLVAFVTGTAVQVDAGTLAERLALESRPDAGIGDERHAGHEGAGIGQLRHQVGDAVVLPGIRVGRVFASDGKNAVTVKRVLQCLADHPSAAGIPG